jgi:hypothetical protein
LGVPRKYQSALAALAAKNPAERIMMLEYFMKALRTVVIRKEKLLYLLKISLILKNKNEKLRTESLKISEGKNKKIRAYVANKIFTDLRTKRHSKKATTLLLLDFLTLRIKK